MKVVTGLIAAILLLISKLPLEAFERAMEEWQKLGPARREVRDGIRTAVLGDPGKNIAPHPAVVLAENIFSVGATSAVVALLSLGTMVVLLAVVPVKLGAAPFIVLGGLIITLFFGGIAALCIAAFILGADVVGAVTRRVAGMSTTTAPSEGE